MADMAILSVGIDFTEAERGAQKTVQAADRISGAFSKLDQQVEKLRKQMDDGLGSGLSKGEQSLLRMKASGDLLSLSQTETARSSEKLLYQLDQLRIGATQLGRGSLGGLPNVLKAFGVAADESAVAAGALSTRALALGITFGGAAVAIAAGAVKLSADVGSLAAELEQLQDKTGLTADRLQFLQSAARVTNVDFDSLTKSFEGYRKAAGDAALGNEDLQKIFGILKVDTRDLSENQFEKLIGKLKGITDETVLLETAQKLHINDVRSLIRYYDELSANGGALRDRVSELSQKMNGEGLKAAKDYNTEVALLKEQWDKLYYSIANGALPIFREFIDAVRNDKSVFDSFNETLATAAQKMNEFSHSRAAVRVEENRLRLGSLFEKGYGQDTAGPPVPSDYRSRIPGEPGPFAGATGFADPNKFKPLGDATTTNALRGVLSNSGGGGATRKLLDETQRLADERLRIMDAYAKASFDKENALTKQMLDLNDFQHQNQLISDEKFFGDKLRLLQIQNQDELAYQDDLLAGILARQQQAKKLTDKLRFEDDAVKLRARIDELKAVGAGLPDLINREATVAATNALNQQQDALDRLNETYKQLTGNEREAFEVGLVLQFADALEKAGKIAGGLGETIINRMNQVKEALRTQFTFGQSERSITQGLSGVQGRSSALEESLALQEDRIQAQLATRLISTAQAEERLRQVRQAAKGPLLELIDQQIKYTMMLNEDSPMEAELLKLQRRKEELQRLGEGFTSLERRIMDFADQTKNVLQDAFYQGIVEGPRAFFQTLLGGFSQLLAKLASELLTSQFVKLLGNLGQGLSGSSGAQGGGFWGTLLKIGGTFLSSLAGGALGGVKLPSAGPGGLFGITSTLGPVTQSVGIGFGPSIGGRASGGYIGASGVYDVGELGRERVWLPQGAYVQNNHDARQAEGGMTFNAGGIHFHLPNVKDPQQFRESQAQIGGRLARLIQQHQRNLA